MTHVVEIETNGTTVPLTDVRYLPVSAVVALASLPTKDVSEQLEIVIKVVRDSLARPTDWDAHLEKLTLDEFTAFVSSWFSKRHETEQDLDGIIADLLREEDR